MLRTQYVLFYWRFALKQIQYQGIHIILQELRIYRARGTNRMNISKEADIIRIFKGHSGIQAIRRAYSEKEIKLQDKIPFVNFSFRFL